MSLWGPLPDDVTTPQKAPNKAAWFNFSIFAGDKSWVAGVELATASEPPARKPRIWGRRPRASTPATPRCNLLLNHANKANLESKQVLESQDCKSETAGAEGRKQSQSSRGKTTRKPRSQWPTGSAEWPAAGGQ